MVDFSTRRRVMVDTQVRPSDVTKFPVIEAMLDIPRESFVPAEKAEAAYVDNNLPLGNGRTLLAPRSFAKMLDALDVQPNELVLDIAPGCGYPSAVMARLAEAVVVLEEATLAEAVEASLAQTVDNVAVVSGQLDAGAEQHGPYDVIVIEGAVTEVPEALLDQLTENGRIAAIFQKAALGELRIGHKHKGRVHWRSEFNATAPLLPGFEPVQSFAF